jgi:hypothetical protein
VKRRPLPSASRQRSKRSSSASNRGSPWDRPKNDSAAGSLVCYALGISNVCPFRFGLSFERFLNRERMQFAKLADIDLDLPWDRRDEVIQYVFDRYGAEHVAMIGAFNTFDIYFFSFSTFNTFSFYI